MCVNPVYSRRYSCYLLGVRILLIDDDVELCTLLLELLKQANYTDPKSLGFDQTSLGLSPLFLTSGIKMFPNFAPESYQFTGQVDYSLIGRGEDVNSITGRRDQDR